MSELLDRYSLDELMDIRQGFKDDVTGLEAQVDKYSGAIRDRLLGHGQTAYKNARWSARVDAKVTRTINRAQLITAGVDPDIIDACTVETTSEPFVVILAIGENRKAKKTSDGPTPSPETSSASDT